MISLSSSRALLLLLVPFFVACSTSDGSSSDDRAAWLAENYHPYECLDFSTSCENGRVCVPEFGAQPPGDNSCGCRLTHQCTAGCAPEFWSGSTPTSLAGYCFESLGLLALGSACDDDDDCVWPNALRSHLGEPANVYRRCEDNVCVEGMAPERLADGTECLPRLESPCGEASRCALSTRPESPSVCKHYCTGDHQCELGLVCDLAKATCKKPW